MSSPDASSNSTASDVPPIVLLVEDDRDTLDMYSTYLEMSGLWVAKSTTARGALEDVAELRPDLVVTDIGVDGEDGPTVELVQALKASPSTQDIPVIVLRDEGADPAPGPLPGADACLVKPVLPDTLLDRIRVLMARSRELHRISQGSSQRAGELGERSNRLLARSRTLISAAQEDGSRACPQCGRPLEWIEQGQIGGVAYDYYRWCRQGCGLYCFDRSAATWVKLV